MNIIEISNNFCLNYLSSLRRIATKLHLTQSQALCLQAIPYDGISQADLAKKLSIDISTLSRNLNKLIILNIIYKTSSLIDKRAFKISLTSKGKDLYAKFNTLVTDDLRSIYNELDVLETHQLHEILNKLNWKLELLNK